MGNVNFELEDYDKAIEYYQKAIAADPNYDPSYYSIGHVYKNTGKYKEALQAFETYIALTINNPDNFTLWAKEQVEEIKKIRQKGVYPKLRKIVDEIKSLLLSKETCITHYTSLSTAKSLISEGSPFRLSEGAFLNDTSEGRNLNEYLEFQNTASESNGTLAELFSRRPFIGSFVKEKQDNNLTLWRMYGKESKEEAKGCAITVEVEKLKTLLQETTTKSKSDGGDIATNTGEIFEFYKVAYRKKEDDKFVLPGARLVKPPN
ncbi:MAG: tetratricopeptide repeat protein [Saprospiraceae bacterium]|nr:tetratricopeptide repeat protein [Saprospiraceae bacterium]